MITLKMFPVNFKCVDAWNCRLSIEFPRAVPRREHKYSTMSLQLVEDLDLCKSIAPGVPPSWLWPQTPKKIQVIVTTTPSFTPPPSWGSLSQLLPMQLTPFLILSHSSPNELWDRLKQYCHCPSGAWDKLPQFRGGQLRSNVQQREKELTTNGGISQWSKPLLACS